MTRDFIAKLVSSASGVAVAVAASIEWDTLALSRAAVQASLPDSINAWLSRNTLAAPTLADDIEAWGDSTVAGVGAPTGFSWPAQFGALVTGGSVNNNGVGGDTSAQVLADVVAATSAQKARHTLVSVGLNDLTVGVADRRDWAASGYTKGNIASMKAELTGGAQMGIVLALQKDVSNPGQQGGADFAYHYRDMIATYGADAINASAYLRAVSAQEGPDLYNVTNNRGCPLSKQGKSTNDIPVNNADFITAAGSPASLNYDPGQMAWDSTALIWRYKLGASGTGSWPQLDDKHRSRWGYADVTPLLQARTLAVLGQGAPFVPPQEFRCAADIAENAEVGQVAIRTSSSATGTADAMQIVFGNTDNVFAIASDGTITRTGKGTLQRQIYELVVKASNANGDYYGIVDVYVGRASTQSLPQKSLIPSPISVCGMEGHGLSSAGKVFSGAAWINCSNVASSPYLLNWPKSETNGGSDARLYVNFPSLTAGGDARVRIQIYNAANSSILLATSSGGVSDGVTPDEWGWLTWNVDLSTGTVNIYWNDTALGVTVSSYSNEMIPLEDMSPLFLNARALSGADDQGVQPFLGGIGYGAVWDALIDWTDSAVRRELFDASFDPAITNSTGTIDGTAAGIVFWQGEPVDMLWGGLVDSQLVQMHWRGKDTVTLA